jgi:hypothetical protein
VIDGKKRIIQAPTEGARSGVDTATFAEGDVWGMDILIASGTDGKVGDVPVVPRPVEVHAFVPLGQASPRLSYFSVSKGQ